MKAFMRIPEIRGVKIIDVSDTDGMVQGCVGGVENRIFGPRMHEDYIKSIKLILFYFEYSRDLVTSR